MRASGSRIAPLIGFAILLAALVIGFVAVLEKRFASGDIYPHYSTQRSDPLGAQALYESLADLPGLEVTRNRNNLMGIANIDGNTTLWLCGLSRAAFEKLLAPDNSPVIQAVKERGARLVITINPQLVPEKYELKEEDNWLERRERLRKKLREEGNEAEDKDSEKEKDEEEELLAMALTEMLEVDIESLEAFERPDEGWKVKRGTAVAPDALPADLPNWRSQFRFTDVGDAWLIAGKIKKAPVIIERKLGQGTVALTTDTYFASNEALWAEPSPDFLMWLTGGKGRIIFDETIHGTVESGGVMKMIRRYRFHGFFYGLLIFVGLLAWKGASSLAPGSEALERGLIQGDGTTSVAGEETSAGLIRMLRHNVPQNRLLRTCLDTWRQTAGKRLRSESEGQRQAIDAVLAAHEQAPKQTTAIDAFRIIAHILAHPDDHRRSNRP